MCLSVVVEEVHILSQIAHEVQLIRQRLNNQSFCVLTRGPVGQCRVSSCDLCTCGTDECLPVGGGMMRAVGGKLAPGESRHISLLRMDAVPPVLRCFNPSLSGKDVLVRADNWMIVAYINRQWEFWVCFLFFYFSKLKKKKKLSQGRIFTIVSSTSLVFCHITNSCNWLVAL